MKEAPAPQNVGELKSYLGLLTYYGKFLHNLATHLSPLYQLLQKDQSWKWGRQEKKSLNRSKELLLSSQFPTHFDPDLELVLACDASAYGIGAVLAHRMPDGTEKPVGYASRTLSKAEKNYSQLVSLLSLASKYFTRTCLATPSCWSLITSHFWVC